MSAFDDELKQKTDIELKEMAATPNRWNDSYIEAINVELKRRGLTVEPIDNSPQVEPKLTLDQRRRICESCKNHKNEIPTNPDSPAICGLTMKKPEFNGEQCALYVPIPNFKTLLLRRAIYSIILGFAIGILGLNMSDSFWGIGLIVLSPVLLIYSIRIFIKMIRFKYPGE